MNFPQVGEFQPRQHAELLRRKAQHVCLGWCLISIQAVMLLVKTLGRFNPHVHIDCHHVRWVTMAVLKLLRPTLLGFLLSSRALAGR